VILRHAETGEPVELPDAGTFIAIGHEPQSQLVAGQVRTDDEGYVITEGRSTRTGRPGVFAAGDLVDHTYRQAVTAAGSGCQAALDAEWYLRDTPEVPTPAGMPEGDLAEAQWAPTSPGVPQR
jgi:thioredoxin reductase (NADPH)